jgi:hypothetical protein
MAPDQRAGVPENLGGFLRLSYILFGVSRKLCAQLQCQRDIRHDRWDLQCQREYASLGARMRVGVRCSDVEYLTRNLEYLS